MRAAFSDPQGPRLWRVLRFVPAFLLLLVAVFGPEAFPGWLFGGMSLLAFQLAGLLPPRQRAMRAVELAAGPGYVEVRNAKTRSQRIFAKDVRGASTARIGSRVLVTLAHAERDQPLTIELESEADAETIRHALGVGHGGYGSIGWRGQGEGGSKSAVVGRVLSIVCGLAVMAVTASFGTEVGLLFGMLASNAILLGVILSVLGWFSRAPLPSIVMAPEGLRLLTPRGWFSLPYDSVHAVEDRGRALVFKVPAPFFEVGVAAASSLFGGLSSHDREALIAQVHSAAQRARGLGPPKNDVAGRVDVLRRNGESARDWLSRLDMAGRMLGAGSGYRGHAFDTEDLWTVFEDPEADAEIRAAAARVLRYAPTPDTRQRIAATLATLRDETIERRLRIAMDDDLDSATTDLSVLDAQESPLARASAGR